MIDKVLSQLLVKVATDSQIGVIVTDKNGLTVWANKHIQAITGYLLEDFLGKTPGQVLQGPETDPAHVEVIRKGLQSGKSFETEIMNYTKEGRKFWVSLQIDPVRNVNNTIEYFLSIQHDITELKEKNEQLENFNYLTSHDLINQVSNLNNLVHMLSPEHIDDSEKRKIAILKLTSSKLKNTTKDLRNLLDYESKQKDLMLAPISVNETIEEACTSLESELKEKDIKLRRSVEGSPFVVANQLYLSSACYNIISNAIKYSDPEKSSELDITTSHVGSQVKIVFKDNGLGIDLEKNRDSMFRAFKTFHNNPEAIGIGLYLTKKQMEACNGSVSVESVPLVGSSFSILIPSA